MSDLVLPDPGKGRQWVIETSGDSVTLYLRSGLNTLQADTLYDDTDFVGDVVPVTEDNIVRLAESILRQDKRRQEWDGTVTTFTKEN